MDHSLSGQPSWFDSSTVACDSPNVPFAKLSLTLLALVALADWLFFDRRPGVSVTVFGAAALACLVLHRPARTWTTPAITMVVLIAGALLGSAIDFNFFNFVVLGMLMSAAMMDEGARACGAGEAVWPMAGAAAVRALAQWGRFVEMASRVALPASLRPAAARAVRFVVPVLLVAVPLLLLLACGNALVDSQLRPTLEGVERWLKSLHLPSPARILFWSAVATGSLSYLYPHVDLRLARLCHEKWRTFAACDDRRVGKWRSVLILASMNALFFWANSIDAWFLWVRRAPPLGQSYSQFLHEGTFALTMTTIFAAVVLVLLTQQDDEVARRPSIRMLALVCVAQNLFLLSSVALRLKLYVEAYELSVLRVHVVTFLVLVAAGYVLLAWRIVFAKSLNWLAFANAVAVLAIFYVVQFLDVRGFVAEYNTTRWLERKTSRLDLAYLRSLGTPALAQFARLQEGKPDSREAQCAQFDLRKARAAWSHRGADWRSWQWRTALIEYRLFANGPALVKPDS